MSATSFNPDSAAGAFWRFSLDLYARPGVAVACLELQDRHGLDVNLVLFAAWVGVSGRGRLSVADLAAAEAAIAPWRRDVIVPLRDLRRRLKGEPDTASLYQSAKAAELDAEHVAQDRLERTAPPRQPGTAPFEDALANVALYLGSDIDVPAPLRAGLAALSG